MKIMAWHGEISMAYHGGRIRNNSMASINGESEMKKKI
jgi:hypothetical protein